MQNFVKELLLERQNHGSRLPGILQAKELADRILSLLIPHFAKENDSSPASIESEISAVSSLLQEMLLAVEKKFPISSLKVTEEFCAALPSIHERLWQDARAILEGDPAAKNIDEVILAYPGFFAIAIYRISNCLHSSGVPILPRLLTEYAHQVTGIDIHPGASIGAHFFIDHGTGIVIGETTVIRDYVKIYQGVTLGALSVEKNLADRKRHPTIEDNVVIYSNATILGGETVIGKNSIIGGNVWVTASVPPESVVYHSSDIRVKNSKQ